LEVDQRDALMAVASHAGLPARPDVWDSGKAPHTDETGAHNVYAHDQVRRVLTDGEAFSADYGINPDAYPYVNPMMIGLWTAGEPRHRDLRAAVEDPFRPRRTAELRPQLRRLADDLIDQVLARGDGQVELIAEVAKPYHLQANCRLLGLDTSHAPVFDHWITNAAEALAVNDIKPDPEQAEFWFKLIDKRRAHPQTGLVDDLIAAQQAGHMVAGQPMSEWDLVGYFGMLLAAGYETISGITNAILFAEEFGVLDALYADPGLLPGAIEESLRFYPPFPTTRRMAITEAHFGEYRIRPEEWVVGWITAANRDPNRFPDPDRYDAQRAPNPHLSLGWGSLRNCLGAPMARLEMLVALEATLERLPGLHRDRSWPLERTYGIVDPLTALPCTFEAAGSAS
jgi:cytochrome P450 family 109